MKNLIVVAIVSVFAISFIGCGGSSKTLKSDGSIQQTITEQANSDRYITALGIGAPAIDVTTSTQKKATSRNAAIVAAQYQLVSLFKGVKITGGVTIEKAMETDSKIQATVNDYVRGAEIVKSEWTNDDGCIVTMRLDKDGLAKQLGATFDKP